MPLLSIAEKVGVVPASRRKIKRTWNAFGGGTCGSRSDVAHSAREAQRLKQDPKSVFFYTYVVECC